MRCRAATYLQRAPRPSLGCMNLRALNENQCGSNIDQLLLTILFEAPVTCDFSSPALRGFASDILSFSILQIADLDMA